MSTEQALVEALNFWMNDRGRAEAALERLRAALPEGTVLTRSGVAKLEPVCEDCQRRMAFDDGGWRCASYCSWVSPLDVTLFILTPERDEL